MRRGMIRILAIAALLLLAGSIPGDANAARRASVRLSLNKSGDLQAQGSGFLPNLSSAPCCSVQVDFNGCTVNDCSFHYIANASTDSRGNWNYGTGFGCPLRTFVVRASDGVNNNITSKTVTNSSC